MTPKLTIKKLKITNAQRLQQAVLRAGYSLECLDSDAQVFIATNKQGHKRFIKAHVADLNTYLSAMLSRDKALVKRILAAKNINVPGGIVESNLKKTTSLVRSGSLKYPLVVKPVIGSQGQAVTVDIRDEATLIKGIEEVYKYNRRTQGKQNSFILEPYVSGDDYRFVVLDGKVLTVLMRKPAYVIADGINSIANLIDRYNAQPGVEKHLPLCPIVRDFEMQRHLQAQGLSEKSILAKGRRIYLRKNANVSTGGRSFECMSKVHSEYIKLASHVAGLLKLRFAAVDLISPNITVFNKYNVIEVNDTPGFDLHEAPYSGKPFPVADHLVQSMFKPTGRL